LDGRGFPFSQQRSSESTGVPSISAVTRTSPEDRFLSELERIDGIIGSICRRNGLLGDDAEEFASLVKLKLIEDEYAVFRKFEGRSSMATYLTIVIANLFRDYRIQRWGRWRPSAIARGLGATAVRLETLVYRDGNSLDEAIEVLRSAGVSESAADLARLGAQLQPRMNPRKSRPEAPETLEAPDRADRAVTEAEAAQLREDAWRTIEQALEALPPEDRVILRLRYWEGMSVADIARTLRLDQKPLYRRIEGDLARLRPLLEAGGVDRELAAELLAAESS
jgi:RNA polymerase sigma factor (sigma-70 family)